MGRFPSPKNFLKTYTKNLTNPLKRLRISVKACILLYFIYYIINNLVYFLWENDKITLISNYICLYIIVFIAYDEYIWKKILVPLLLATIG